MKDLKIDPKTNDLVMVDGDLALVDGIDRIKQHVTTGVYIMPYDWVLDYTMGINFITGLKAFPELLRADIKKEIQSVWGVDNLLNYRFKMDEFGVYQVTGVIKSGNTEIPFSTEVNYANQ